MNLSFFRNKRGLEIAGPSKIFQDLGPVPIYSVVADLDDFSFPRPHEWGGRNLRKGKTYFYNPGNKAGRQFIGDAVNLTGIPSGCYDFLMASHVIEHIANPIKAVSEWIRVLKPRGVMLLIVPHRDGTFDRKRPLTELKHLCNDYENGVPENDRTHFAEVQKLSTKQFPKEWFDSCGIHRGLHHHVFDTRLIIEVLNHLRLQIMEVDHKLPHNIVIVARKRLRPSKAMNNPFRNTKAAFTISSPFISDTSSHLSWPNE